MIFGNEGDIASLTLPAGKKEAIAWDWGLNGVSGFGVRLRAGGSRTFVFRYRLGRQRTIKIGPVGSISLKDARKRASRLALEVQAGKDPARARETAKVEAASTVAILVEQYLDAHKAKWRPTTYVEYRRYLAKYAKPLHHLPIGAVTQRDVAVLLNAIANERGDPTANRFRASLRAFIQYVIQQGIPLPQGNIASYTARRKEAPRDRVLKEDELRRIWLAAGDDGFGAALRLLILTGQRQMEIGALRWDEIQGDQIVLPAHRTKNRRAHLVPLSGAARDILDRLNRDIAHVFGGSADTGFWGWAQAKVRLDARTGPLAHWTFHDIRRSVATYMAELGVQPHIVEAVLNHVSGHKSGVAGVYNRAAYDKEKRAALSLWAEHITAIVENRAATVVPMRRA